MYLQPVKHISATTAPAEGGDWMLVTTAIGRRDEPTLPVGRVVELPDRGSMFVRESPGPAGAPVILLLHGWSATADLNWHPYFEPLSRHFRVIAIDQRGHGRGIRPAEAFRLEDCADDAAALADAFGIERLIVVGYSMGGPVAQLLWKRHRRLVDGLVFCSTSATFRCNARLRMLFRAAAGMSAVRVAGPMSTVANSALSAVSKWNGLRGEMTWGVEQLARHDWSQLVEAGRQIGRYDARPWIGSISVPTSVIATLDDEVIPTRNQLSLAHSIPNATLRHFPGGHHQCVTDPDRFASVLLPACREVAARSSVCSSVVDAAVA